MNAADPLDGQRNGMVDVALHDPFETVAQADDFDARHARADRGRGDNAVESGSGSAPAENCELVMSIHWAGIVISWPSGAQFLHTAPEGAPMISTLRVGDG